MIGEPTEEWYRRMLLEFQKDLRFRAECSLLGVTDEICQILGQPRGIYRILFWLLQWCANKLIWRKFKIL